MEDRKSIRRHIRNRRRQLNDQERRQSARQLKVRLLSLPILRSSRSLAAYYPSDGEISLLPTLSHCMGVGKRVYLPRISPMRRDRRMVFLPFAEDSPMVENFFGIPEPKCERFRGVSARQLDLILLPLVAFDARGNRIGMGGGYYDGTLAFRRHRKTRLRPKLIGVAYQFQQMPSIEAHHWDIPLDMIVTDQQLIYGLVK